MLTVVCGVAAGPLAGQDPVVLAAAVSSSDAVGLPEAPMPQQSGQRPDPKAVANDPTNPLGLPIVNGRPYLAPKGKQRVVLYEREVFRPTAFLFPLVSAAIALGQNTPKGWNQDFTGYGQRYGSLLGQQFIRSTVRLGMSAALHEDTYYRICHHCSVKDKIMNAVLAEFTARHGADGARRFSVTPIVAGYSGSLVATTVWYPDGYGPRDGAVRGTTSIGTRMLTHAVREFLFDRDSRCEKAAKAGVACAPKGSRSKP